MEKVEKLAQWNFERLKQTDVSKHPIARLEQRQAQTIKTRYKMTAVAVTKQKIIIH